LQNIIELTFESRGKRRIELVKSRELTEIHPTAAHCNRESGEGRENRGEGRENRPFLLLAAITAQSQCVAV